MSPPQPEGWQELQLPSRKECPKLFYLFSTANESLSLSLTDLISIWECSLDKYDIIAEAGRQQASIDPSESKAQFEVLLSKLTQSLQDGQNALARDEKRASQDLLLVTRTALPRPLKPLKWSFTLAQQNAADLAERLLRPSLHEVSVSQAKITSLLDIVKEKDHIISRLLDRIGASGVDLGLIFPGISGVASRKGAHLSVSDAKRHVPGMASFNEKSWIRQFANDDGYEGADRTGLGNLVSGCEKCFVHTREQHEGWLRSLPGPGKLDQMDDPPIESSQTGNAKNKSQASRRKPLGASQDSSEDSTDSDDDFERQATPPERKIQSPQTKRKISPESKADNESEASDNETKAKRKKTGKIGGLGRRNATKAYGDSGSAPKATSPPKHMALSRRDSNASTSTATATASEADHEPDVKNSKSRPVTSADTDSDSPKQHGLHQNRQKGKSSGSTGSTKPRLGKLKSAKASSSARTPTSSPSPPSPPRSPSRSESKSPIGTRSRRNLRQHTNTPDRGALPESKSSPVPPPSSRTRRLGRLNNSARTTPEKPDKDDEEEEDDDEDDEDDDLDAPPKTRSQLRYSSQHEAPPPPTTNKATSSSPTTSTPSRRRLGRLGGARNTRRDESASPDEIPRSPLSPSVGSVKKKKQNDRSTRRTRQGDGDDDGDGEGDLDTADVHADADTETDTSSSSSSIRKTRKTKHKPPTHHTSSPTAKTRSVHTRDTATRPADDNSYSPRTKHEQRGQHEQHEQYEQRQRQHGQEKQKEPEPEPEPQPEPEETAEQKADRRRAELKRSIASGAGVKKRRRF